MTREYVTNRIGHSCWIESERKEKGKLAQCFANYIYQSLRQRKLPFSILIFRQLIDVVSWFTWFVSVHFIVCVSHSVCVSLWCWWKHWLFALIVDIFCLFLSLSLSLCFSHNFFFLSFFFLQIITAMEL